MDDKKEQVRTPDLEILVGVAACSKLTWASLVCVSEVRAREWCILSASDDIY